MMSSFWKPFNHKAVNDQWEDDLTRWLKECKKIATVTKQELVKWDAILNNDSAPEDTLSFCKYTGWQYGRLPKDLQE